MNEKTMETMFSSKTEEWETPQDLFDHLDFQYRVYTLPSSNLFPPPTHHVLASKATGVDHFEY